MKVFNIDNMIPVLLLCSASAFAQTPTTPAGSGMKADSMPGMTMTGDSDKDFAVMMKMHHQKALEMANKELAEGKSAQMKAMAQRILDSQTKEIAEFDKWLAARK